MSLDLGFSRFGARTLSGAVRFEVTISGASSGEEDPPEEEVESSSSEQDDIPDELIEVDRLESSSVSTASDGADGADG